MTFWHDSYNNKRSWLNRLLTGQPDWNHNTASWRKWLLTREFKKVVKEQSHRLPAIGETTGRGRAVEARPRPPTRALAFLTNQRS